MIKQLVVISAVSAIILFVPDWKPPYTYLDAVIILVGYFGTFGPWVLLFFALLNRLLNISLRTK